MSQYRSKSKQLQIRISPEDLEKIKKCAEEECPHWRTVSVSRFVLRVVFDYIQEKKKKKAEE